MVRVGPDGIVAPFPGAARDHDLHRLDQPDGRHDPELDRRVRERDRRQLGSPNPPQKGGVGGVDERLADLCEEDRQRNRPDRPGESAQPSLPLLPGSFGQTSVNW